MNSSNDNHSNKYFQMPRVRNMESFVGTGGKTGDIWQERGKQGLKMVLLGNMKGQNNKGGHKGAAGSCK